MSRYFPHPLMFVALLLMWLALTRFSLGHLVLGSAIAMGASWVVGLLRPKRVRIRSWRALIVLFFTVGYDIIRSNIQVAVIIVRELLGHKRSPGFILLKLRLRDRNALATLAMIITATPGTAWIEHDPEDGRLLLHILDLREEQDWQVLIGDRYELLLMEIFE